MFLSTTDNNSTFTAKNAIQRRGRRGDEALSGHNKRAKKKNGGTKRKKWPNKNEKTGQRNGEGRPARPRRRPGKTRVGRQLPLHACLFINVKRRIRTAKADGDPHRDGEAGCHHRPSRCRQSHSVQGRSARASRHQRSRPWQPRGPRLWPSPSRRSAA